MPRSAPATSIALAAALAISGCSSALEPAGCTTDAQCPQASRCAAGVCTADARPSASIRAPVRVEEFALVQLDGSGSADPDADDVRLEHAWTVRPLSAECEAPVVAGDGPVASVRFGCRGRHTVTLVVRDALGVESEPATVEVDVGPATGTPIVLAGADVATDHECAGDPLVCRPTEIPQLSATTLAPGSALRWSVVPPVGRPLDETRRVSFSPGPDATSPKVSIETDGTAISGDWIFRVEARDAFGVIGAAYTRVSIKNRAPVVVAAPPPSFPHAFDAARSLLTSSGEIVYAAYDPDGDPIELAGLWRHAGDGGASFDGALLPDRVTFSISVPRASPEDALRLRGGSGLERTIELLARDANRAEIWARWPVIVGNRPPVPVAPPASAVVGHAFDRARSRYVAHATLGAWVDPDDDPLSASGGAAPCEAIALVDGVAQVECAVPYDGTPAADRIAGRHAVPLHVSDPWASGPISVHTVEVLNFTPRISATVDSPPLTCTASVAWCKWPVETGINIHASQFEVLPAVFDPDGDPVAVSPVMPYGGVASQSLAVCTAEACAPFRFDLPSILGFCRGDETPAALRASDGGASVEIATVPPLSGC